MMVKGFGWLPDVPDIRDHQYSAPQRRLTKLPSFVNLRHLCPAIYNQGQLGSCTANAIGAAYQFEEMRQGLDPSFRPSRLFIYYNERVIEHTVNSDSGAQIRDGIKTVAHQGVCPERLWPYDIAKFRDKPTPVCYRVASKHKTVHYRRVRQDLWQMQGCLAGGFPIVVGFTVYKSFESQEVAKTGHAPMPRLGERVLGGHAVLVVGYNDPREWFILRNSWGPNWGMKGYFTLPYTYLLTPQLASSFWTIRLVEPDSTKLIW
jgi:C1A family cysteine protease